MVSGTPFSRVFSLLKTAHTRAPKGFDRIIDLIEAGFFDDNIVYRVVAGSHIQFGLPANPKMLAAWRQIPDDPPQPAIQFSRGTVSFLGDSPLPNSRSTQILISDEPHGLSMGSAPHERPIGRIIDPEEATSFLASCYAGYGDTNFLSTKLRQQGNAAAAQYPKLTRIGTCTIGRQRWSSRQRG